MPLEDRTHSNGRVGWSEYYGDGRGDNTIPTIPQPSQDVANVPVETTDWTSDNALYEDAPIHGNIWYADVEHNLRSEFAYPITYREDGNASLNNSFLDRQYVDINTVRVWLRTKPSNTITVKVIR